MCIFVEGREFFHRLSLAASLEENLNTMSYITPHQYLRELKELLNQEKEKLSEQKNLIAKAQDYETAALYRQIEKKLDEFLENLEFKNQINTTDYE